MKKKKKQRNDLCFNAQDYLQQMTGGVDLTQIDGLGAHSVLRILSEIGVDMNRWPSAKHFGSWLGLAPGTKISGGKDSAGKQNLLLIVRPLCCEWRQARYIEVRRL